MWKRRLNEWFSNNSLKCMYHILLTIQLIYQLYIYISMYISIYLCIYLYINVYIYVYIYTSMYISIHLCIYLCVYLYTYVYIYISMYILCCTANNMTQYLAISNSSEYIQSIYHYMLIIGSNVHWVSLNHNTNHNSQRIYTFGKHQLKGALFTPHLTLNWLNDGEDDVEKDFD
jgi:hypothetical protein